MASTKKNLKLASFIDYRMRVDLRDGRTIRGQMLGFDKHMNLVLADAEEIRQTRRKNKTTGQLQTGEEKRVLGLIILRGGEVIACNPEGPPPADPAARLGAAEQKPATSAVVAAAAGISRPAGRGAGLQGPAAGVGGPGFGQFPQPGFPGVPGFGRGVPGGFPGAPQGFAPPPGMPGFAPQGAPGFPPPAGRGFPPGGFQGQGH